MEYAASALRLLNSHTLSQRERNAAINRAVELANNRRLAYVTYSCVADALADVEAESTGVSNEHAIR